MKKTILTGLLILNTVLLFAQIADRAQRKVRLQGAVNFRDVGGYATKDGHHVKWGKIYRSADLSKLTDADLAELKKRNINYDVDLRGRPEADQAPDKLNPNTDYILCPAGSDSVTIMIKQFAAHKNVDSVMNVFYSNTLYLKDRYTPFFNKLLVVPDDQSLVFHCTAGKDRTGIAAALFLYALGVPYETIAADYTATNYYRQSENQKSVNGLTQLLHLDPQAAKSVTSAKKEYLDANFAAISKRYGSVDNFLKNEIGLTDAQLRVLKRKYLQ